MKAEIGTVSEGTLRPQDLLGVFAGVLHDLDGHDSDDVKLCEEAEALAYVEEVEEREWTADEVEQADEMVSELGDRLGALAPPYTYFGSHEGDGSDFGFWPSIEQLEEDARHDDDVVKVPSVPSYLMQVSDHGNVTLYAVEKVSEVWSTV